MRYMHHCIPFCLEDHNKQNVKLNPVHDKLTWPFIPFSESARSNIVTLIGFPEYFKS